MSPKNIPHQAKSMADFVKKSSIFLSFLLLVLYFIFQSSWHNLLAEHSFLTYHHNKFAINVSNSLPDNRKDYYTHFLLGRIYFVENDLNQSIKHYNKSIELNPAHKESYYGLGLSYGFHSPIFYKDAQDNFEKYIELEEEEFKESGRRAYGAWAGYNDLAWIHFLKGEFQESETITRQALVFSQENPWLLNMLAISLIEQKKCLEAYPIIQNAKNLADKLVVEEFAEAYSGDNKNWWPKGLEQMKQTLQHNLLICANVK